ncbi:hypothetical protein WA026_005454 [Henosepilachna vigintioctopunctata]|uniref:N-acetyltransferase domain-containing protein n=1 Tax=Henosepilachna vigintioctopunctata TaxID=420089 RepID=A0AAW1U380_9CUCU
MLNFSRSLQIFLRNSITFSTPLRQVKTLSPKKLKEHNTVIIVSPTCVDYKNIANFMKEHYFPNEPTCQALGVKGYTILLDQMIASLTQGLSLVAKNKTTGEIMGVALNEKTTPWDADLNDKLAVTIQCDNLKKLLHFYATLERAPNIFQKYNVSEVFEIANLAVSSHFRKKGIAKKLMIKSKEIAKKMDFEILRVDATSFYR